MMGLVVARSLVAQTVVRVSAVHSAVSLIQLLLRLVDERTNVVDEVLFVTIPLLLRLKLLDVLRKEQAQASELSG